MPPSAAPAQQPQAREDAQNEWEAGYMAEAARKDSLRTGSTPFDKATRDLCRNLAPHRPPGLEGATGAPRASRILRENRGQCRVLARREEW
jgi:hypothetical protein